MEIHRALIQSPHTTLIHLTISLLCLFKVYPATISQNKLTTGLVGKVEVAPKAIMDTHYLPFLPFIQDSPKPW